MPRHQGDMAKISNEKRSLLVHHKFSLYSDVDFVMRNCFLEGELQKKTIELLWKKLDNMSGEEIQDYMEGKTMTSGPSGNVGRKRSIPHGSEDEQYLKELVESNLSAKLEVITSEFHNWFYEQHRHDTILNPLCLQSIKN